MSNASANHHSPMTTALARLVSEGADAAIVGARVALAWRAIDAKLSPVIGPQGVAALHSRSLHVCLSLHPLLNQMQSGIELALDLAAIERVLASQDAREAAAAGGAVLDAFWALLTDMVGASLTEEILGTVWAHEPHMGANSAGELS